MDSVPFKKDWSITPAAFERLLQELDPAREAAAEKYELIRNKLMSFFRWRACPTPEEYADRTIDRVARRLEEGAALQAEITRARIGSKDSACVARPEVLRRAWEAPRVWCI